MNARCKRRSQRTIKKIPRANIRSYSYTTRKCTARDVYIRPLKTRNKNFAYSCCLMHFWAHSRTCTHTRAQFAPKKQHALSRTHTAMSEKSNIRRRRSTGRKKRKAHRHSWSVWANAMQERKIANMSAQLGVGHSMRLLFITRSYIYMCYVYICIWDR